MPAVEVRLLPLEEPTEECKQAINFDWHIKDYTESELILKLNFEEPSCVSYSSNEGDLLIVTIYDVRRFIDEDAVQINPEIVL